MDDRPKLPGVGRWPKPLAGVEGAGVMITLIKLERGHCVVAGPFSTWDDADAQLFRWAQSTPEPGQGYDKITFTVAWADGVTYSGRYNLNRRGEDCGKDSHRDGHSISRHIRQQMNFLAHVPHCPGFFRTGPDGDSDMKAEDAVGFHDLMCSKLALARMRARNAEAAAKFRDSRLSEESPLHPALERFWCCDSERVEMDDDDQ